MNPQIAQSLKIPGYSAIPYPTGLDPKKFENLGSITSSFLPYAYVIAGLLLLAFLIMGGFQYLVSQGDPKAAQSAQTKLTSAFVGFVIVFVSYWVFQIAGIMLGVNFFN